MHSVAWVGASGPTAPAAGVSLADPLLAELPSCADDAVISAVGDAVGEARREPPAVAVERVGRLTLRRTSLFGVDRPTAPARTQSAARRGASDQRTPGVGKSHTVTGVVEATVVPLPS